MFTVFGWIAKRKKKIERKIRNCIIFTGEKNPDCKIPKLLRFFERNCIIFHTFVLIFSYFRWHTHTNSVRVAVFFKRYAIVSNLLFPAIAGGIVELLFVCGTKSHSMKSLFHLITVQIRTTSSQVSSVSNTIQSTGGTILRHEIWYSIYHTF